MVLKIGRVSVLNNNGGIQLSVTVNSQRHKFAPVPRGRYDNERDLRTACSIADQIDLDVARDQFDPTLAKYRLAPQNAPLEAREQLSLYKLWVKYLDSKYDGFAASTRMKFVEPIQRLWEGIDCADDETVDSFCKRIEDKYSPTTIKNLYKQLRACYNWAADNDLVESNPFVRKFKSVKAQKRGTSCEAFTSSEVKVILAAFCKKSMEFANDNGRLPWWHKIVKFALMTGMRPSEISALTWADILDGCIRVNKAYSHGELKTTKTGKERYFPINEDLDKAFCLSNSKVHHCNNELVFPSPGGKNINMGAFSRFYWKPIVGDLANKGEIRRYLPLYNCRHTFISLCLQNGIDAATVASWVGNSASVIMTNYAAANPDIKPPIF